VEYAYNTSTSVSASDSTSFGYGPGGALIQSITTALSRTVSFPSPFQVGDAVAVEVAGSQAGPWVPVVNSVSPTGTGNVIPYQSQNGVTYGIGILQPGAAGTSTVTLAFGTYAVANGATYGAAGQAWSVGVGAAYWRVRKMKGGQAVGFGAFQAASTANPAGISGLVPAAGLPGRTDGVAVAAGYVGEVVTSGQLGGAITISNSIAALGSQLLHAGSWLIIATASFNGSAGNTYFGAYLGTNPASSTGTTQGETAGFAMVVSANGVGGTITLSKTVNISADTTYYLNCVTSTGTAGSGGILGNIKAVRIA